MRGEPNSGQFICWITMALLFLLPSCSQRTDKARFAAANADAKAVDAAIEKGDYDRAATLLKKYSGEVAALKSAPPKTGNEKELADAHEFLLSMYRDGFLLLKYRNEFRRYGFVRQGLIYVGQDVDPIVERYRLKPEFHVYGPTGQKWKSIPEDSVKIVWANCGEQLRRIGYLMDEQ